MKVVVTGASGLIGSTVAKSFTDANADVVAVTRRVMPVAHRSVSVLDLRRQDSIPVLVSHVPDLIVHAAAVLPLGFFGDKAESAAAQNRAIDDVVVRAAVTTGCRLIFISGTSLYGCVQTMCSEETAVHPRGPYLEEKRRMEERMAELPVVGTVLRVSSPYGLAQRAPTVLQKFLRQAIAGDDLRYFGTGAREQDFIAVEDVAAAVVSAAQANVPGIFNIASGQPTTMKELADLAIRAAQKTESRVIPASEDDPEEQCLARFDVSKSAQELGWRPVVDLAEGLRRLAVGVRRLGSVPTSR